MAVYPQTKSDAVLLKETTQVSQLGTTLPSGQTGQARMPGGGGGNAPPTCPQATTNPYKAFSLGIELTRGFCQVASLSLASVSSSVKCGKDSPHLFQGSFESIWDRKLLGCSAQGSALSKRRSHPSSQPERGRHVYARSHCG